MIVLCIIEPEMLEGNHLAHGMHNIGQTFHGMSVANCSIAKSHADL